MLFRDRGDAGLQLVQRLLPYAFTENLLVLGIPRGGVVVAAEIAEAFNAPLDVFLSRKLRVPNQKELAFGAVAESGRRYLDNEIIRSAGLTESQVEQITNETLELLREDAKIYRRDRGKENIAGRTVILVDDGIATGASMLAAVKALGESRPAAIIVAVPVAPRATHDWLKTQVDDLACLYTPSDFYAVSQFYESFPQVPTQEIAQLLTRAGRRIPCG